MEEKTKKIVEAIGEFGKVWENYGKCRVYLNVQKVFEAIGYSFEFHKSGTVSDASFNGEKISNSKAKKVLESVGISPFVDALTGEVEINTISGWEEYQNQFVEFLNNRIEEALTEEEEVVEEDKEEENFDEFETENEFVEFEVFNKTSCGKETINVKAEDYDADFEIKAKITEISGIDCYRAGTPIYRFKKIVPIFEAKDEPETKRNQEAFYQVERISEEEGKKFYWVRLKLRFLRDKNYRWLEIKETFYNFADCLLAVADLNVNEKQDWAKKVLAY